MPFLLLLNSSATSFNLFSSPPPIPSSLNTKTHNRSPLPIPIPTPTRLPRKKNLQEEENQNETSTEKRKRKGRGKQVYKHNGHRTTKLGEERGVTIGEDGLSYKVAGAPFDFKFSYSETPKVKPLALREPPYVPFALPMVNRPWTGRAPLPKSKKMLPELDSFNPPKPGTKGVKYVQPPGPFFMGNGPNYDAASREEILGEPLTREEKYELLQKSIHCTRQINLGRDGLTHNMLELIHTHWKRRRVCKIKCKGVPTIDMDNVCHHLEEKTGGKIIHRVGGVVHLFRGRHYNYKDRPRFPVMLWKPATPVYPKLIVRAPEGLTREEADALRKKGRHIPSICKLGKNGVYFHLVKDVREAFEETELVRINCQGMKPTDYKRIGAKLKELVPCALLSFDKENILMWRGKDYKATSSKESAPVPSAYGSECLGDNSADSRVTDIQSSDQIICTNLGESTSLNTELGKESSVAASKDAALEDIMITSQCKESLEDELNRLPILVQSTESTVLAEKDTYDVVASKGETSIEVKDSSELACAPERSELVLSSEIEGRPNATNVSGYAGVNSTYHSTVAVNSSKTSNESLSFSTTGVGVFDEKLMETTENGSLDLLSKIESRGQKDMHAGDNVSDDKDTKEKRILTSKENESLPSSTTGVGVFDEKLMETTENGSLDLLSKIESRGQKDMHAGDNVSDDKDTKEKRILTSKEADGCHKSEEHIERLWQQAVESRTALLLDGSSLDPDTVLEKSDDFAQTAPPGPYVKHKWALSERKASRRKKRSMEDEESNQSEGKKTPQHIMSAEMEDIPPFSDIVPVGMLPVDDLAKLLLAQ